MSAASNKRAALYACVPVLLGAFFGSAPSSAPAAQDETPLTEEATPLTPELATLAEPAVAAAPEAVQAEAIALPAEGPGSLIREGGDVVVEAHFEGGAAARTAALEAAGATVLETSARYQTVALAIAPEDLGALAEVPGLEAVAPSLQPVFYGAEEEGSGATPSATTSLTSNGLCEGGSVISQAMTQLHVAAARGVFGARGAGQTIGVISDSFNTATEAIGGGAVPTRAGDDEVSNDLPGPASTCSGQQVPVRVVAEGPAEGTDEGRAMLQVVHDLAPHAELAFATAYSTELEFAHNVELLAAPVSAGGGGADVIVDDVAYFAEPFFQDGPVAVAIRHVTEAGVTYLTAAGNDNLIQGTNEFGSWERSEFKDTECPSAVGAGVVGEASSKACLNFSPSGADPTFGITVEPESTLTLDLQWAEPWYGVEADLNAYLLTAGGALIGEVKPRRNVGPGALRQPIELFGWENKSTKSTEVQLVIDRCIQTCNSAAKVTAKPRLKFILMEDGAGVSKTEYPKSESAAITVGPTIYGHAGSAAAITLAAANYQQSATAPVRPETYSSRGPVTHYFGPVTGAATPAAKLASAETLQKPNVTATDCASTTFFASLAADGWHFCGTSEAAPHAAAIAALMRQTQPLATAAQILAGLESSATKFTTVNSPAAVGAGLLNAEAAIAAIGGSPVSDPASTVVGATVVAPVGETIVTPTAGTTETTTTTTKKSTSGTGAVEPRPKVRIAAHPKVLERTRRASVVGHFRFTSDQSGITFYCRVDGSAQRVCGERFRRRFRAGHHLVKVRAVDSSTGSSSAAAAFRFRVLRVGR
jgi:Subtilase family